VDCYNNARSCIFKTRGRDMATTAYDVGMVGLGVMGRSLVLNMADHGFAVAGYDKDPAKGRDLLSDGSGKPVGAAGNVAEFVGMLKSPRAVLLLVAPAPVVDAVLRDLLPHLAADDVVIDAGNSFFKDTDRRAKALAEKGVHYYGMGVSGGEAGARHVPSMMFGGPREGYERVRPVLEALSAKVNGEPCVTLVGGSSSGHYVKMVHNGIEYGLMQLIAETYDLLKRGLGLTNDELHATFDAWNKGELNSYLLEITARIFLKADDKGGGRLVDRILGVARQKGTGKWASQDALDLGVPIPTIDAAVTMRNLSGQDDERRAAARVLKGPGTAFDGDKADCVKQLRDAFHAAMIVTYAQGMDLLRRASAAYKYALNLEDVARIWRGGCIIRAALLEDIRAAYKARPDLPNLLTDSTLAAKLAGKQGGLRFAVQTAVRLGIPAAAFMASLCYYDGLRSDWLPANLIQAQRDFFGAHTYERVDEPGIFHTRWE
jgi:6-phosphogluconate dehydrogenase